MKALIRFFREVWILFWGPPPKKRTKLVRIDPAEVGFPPTAEVYSTDLGDKD